jgi:hypothetical protein
MLVHMRENNSRSERSISFMTNDGGDVTADSLFMDMLNSGRFADTLQSWHWRQGLTVQPISNTDATINPSGRDPPTGIVGIAAAAPRCVINDVTARSSAEDCEDSCDGDVLGPLEDNAPISYDNSQDIFNFAGFDED